MVQTTLSALLFVGTGIVLLAPQVPVIRKVSEYSVHIMLGMLLFSLLLLAVGRTKVMFAGLACTAALCIFLKNASHNTFKHPKANEETKLNVAHINLGNITFEFGPILKILIDEDIDMVSFQEFTPAWKHLASFLRENFPYSSVEVRVDPYGLAVFSQVPFISKDIFLCDDIPSMSVIIEKENKKFQVVSSYLTPALDNKSLKVAAEQLNIIADKIIDADLPLIALGEYNMVYWTNEIRGFRAKAKLQNSRRDLVDGNLRVPYDHIFFSNALECTQFKEIKDLSQNYIGIMGTYQIKKENEESVTRDTQLSHID